METQGLRRAYGTARHFLLQPRFQNILHHLLWIGFALFVLVNAWVSEDAYITLRVIDNFFNGYGLRWNINERVQVDTSHSNKTRK